MPSWEGAVHEIVGELQSVARKTPDRKWDFGMVFISGFNDEENVVLEVTRLLDTRLGTDGCLLGLDAAAAGGSLVDDGANCQEEAGINEDHTKSCSSITVTAMRLPRQEDGGLSPDVVGARPFAIGKEELLQISMLTLELQETVGDEYYHQTGVRNPTPLAWRRYLGIHQSEPQGILLFADPGISHYNMKQVLGSLDLAFPSACKVGGVCSHMRDCRLVVANGLGEQPAGAEGKVAGLVLPSSVALHTLLSRGGFHVGPRLQVTKAQGHIVTEINNESPQKAIATACKSLGPLDEVLINRNGLLMGVETRKEELISTGIMDKTSPGTLRDRSSDQYLVRSFEFMPDGELYVRSHNFNQVPAKVGEPQKNVQLHVRDDYRAQEDCMLMLKRYTMARLCFQDRAPPACSGAMLFHCSAWTAGVSEFKAELRNALGQDDLMVASAILRGEIGPRGIGMGGVDSRRTDRHGHTVIACLFCYSPPLDASRDADECRRQPVDELPWRV